MDISFQWQKTSLPYPEHILFQEEYEKVVKNPKRMGNCKTHCYKNLQVFANISGTSCGILRILIDSDSAVQGLYSEKKYIKINAKTRIHC
jgi:hypothetical protein